MQAARRTLPQGRCAGLSVQQEAGPMESYGNQLNFMGPESMRGFVDPQREGRSQRWPLGSSMTLPPLSWRLQMWDMWGHEQLVRALPCNLVL